MTVVDDNTTGLRSTHTLPTALWDFEHGEPLVTVGKVEVGISRLTGVISWLVAAVRDQKEGLQHVGNRLDAWEDGGRSSASVAPSSRFSATGTHATAALMSALEHVSDNGSATDERHVADSSATKPDSHAKATQAEPEAAAGNESSASASLDAEAAGRRPSIVGRAVTDPAVNHDGFAAVGGQITESTSTRPDPKEKTSYIKDALLVMEIGKLRYEIRQEIFSAANELKDRINSLDRRLHGELATATGGLHEQVMHISEDVVGQLQALETRAADAEAGLDESRTLINKLEESISTTNRRSSSDLEAQDAPDGAEDDNSTGNNGISKALEREVDARSKLAEAFEASINDQTARHEAALQAIDGLRQQILQLAQSPAENSGPGMPFPMEFLGGLERLEKTTENTSCDSDRSSKSKGAGSHGHDDVWRKHQVVNNRAFLDRLAQAEKAIATLLQQKAMAALAEVDPSLASLMNGQDSRQLADSHTRGGEDSARESLHQNENQNKAVNEHIGSDADPSDVESFSRDRSKGSNGTESHDPASWSLKRHGQMSSDTDLYDGIGRKHHVVNTRALDERLQQAEKMLRALAARQSPSATVMVDGSENEAVASKTIPGEYLEEEQPHRLSGRHCGQKEEEQTHRLSDQHGGQKEEEQPQRMGDQHQKVNSLSTTSRGFEEDVQEQNVDMSTAQSKETDQSHETEQGHQKDDHKGVRRSKKAPRRVIMIDDVPERGTNVADESEGMEESLPLQMEDSLPSQTQETVPALMEESMPAQRNDDTNFLELADRMAVLEDQLKAREESDRSRSMEDHAMKSDLIERLETVENSTRRQVRWGDVQAELESVRKLFDFVHSVLPKDAADAMNFFKKAWSERSDVDADTANPAEMEFHRAKLEAEVRGQSEELRREFENLSRVLKGMQRELEHTSDMTADLVGKVARVEQSTSQPRKDHDDGEAQLITEHLPPLSDLSHLLPDADPGVGAQPLFATKRGLQNAIDDLKDDVRNWLDALHSNMVSSLQHKADSEQLAELAKQLAQAAGVDRDSMIANFAKRPLLGKCASCDAEINADPRRITKPQPISLKGPWPPPGKSGATVCWRPPDGRPLELRSSVAAPAPVSSSPAPPIGGPTSPKLPRMQELRGNKDFPKGKILRSTASEPGFRQAEAAATEPDVLESPSGPLGRR